MTPALLVQDLHFTYPDGRVALHGVDLTVAAGSRVAILGPNGAGKTTLALHLNGILVPDRGRVEVDGVPVVEENLREVRQRVGLVFQDANDQLFMPSVWEDVAFGPANLGLSGETLDGRVESALANVGGTDFARRPPHHLSGGERRRAALATVLAMDPALLVFDEPTGGLDPAGRRELVGALVDLPMTQLVITHDLSLALELCPTSVIMSEGRIAVTGPTAEILADDSLLEEHRLALPYGFSLSGR